MKLSLLTVSPPSRQITLMFEPPILQDLDPPQRKNTIACLARILMEAGDLARKENGDEEN